MMLCVKMTGGAISWKSVRNYNYFFHYAGKFSACYEATAI